MPYDSERVKRSLEELEDLHIHNENQREKYEAGFKVIMEIGEYVKRLKPIYDKINNLYVDRSDLSSKKCPRRGKKNTLVKNACKYYLETLGFDFNEGIMEGEIGCLVRDKEKNAKHVCTLFINKQADTGDSFRKWSSALMKGFVPYKHENHETETTMKAAVVGIEICIYKFNHLHIKTEEE